MDFDRYITSVSLKSPVPKNSYLKNLPAVRHLEREPIEFSSRVTFFAGENGSGKSTLIEAIAAAFGFNPEGGSLNSALRQTPPIPSSISIFFSQSSFGPATDSF